MMGERSVMQEALFYEFSIERLLVGGEGFAVDASLIRADANRQRSAEGSEPVDWKAMAETRRSVQE